MEQTCERIVYRGDGGEFESPIGLAVGRHLYFLVDPSSELTVIWRF